MKTSSRQTGGLTGAGEAARARAAAESARRQRLAREAERRRRVEAARTRALHEIGRRAAAYARDRCPVQSGRLRGSIAYRVRGGTVQLHSSVPYANCVEYGTRRQRAQPFLRPAMREHTREYARIVEREMQKALKGN